MNGHDCFQPLPRRRWLAATLAGAIGTLSGCGQQVYEQRLAESAKYFTYIQKVDSNLAAAWKNGPTNPGPVEQLRVPLQFKEVKPLPPTKNPETGQLVEPDVDPRQPDYIQLEWPGLVGTWEAPLRVVVDGQPAVRKGYLYILTNAYMFARAEESRRAPDFVRDLLNLITEKLSLKPVDPIKDMQREQFPRSQPSYVAPKAYDVYRLADAFMTDGAPYSLELFVQHAGPVDAIVLLALPVATDSNERLAERVPLMLETLRVSSRPPAAPAKRTGGAAAPPATGGGF